MVSPFVEGQEVKVLERRWPGSNKPGGVARVTRINEDGTVAVAYVVGSEKEACVEAKVSSPSALLLLLPLRLPLLLLCCSPAHCALPRYCIIPSSLDASPSLKNRGK